MDKLEYVLMKYKIGFMPVELVLRAIENFRSLCRYRNNFHSCASNYIAKSAYLPETSKLVLVILDEVLPAPDTSENCKDVDEKNF
jgi:hypothetical protein